MINIDSKDLAVVRNTYEEWIRLRGFIVDGNPLMTQDMLNETLGFCESSIINDIVCNLVVCDDGEDIHSNKDRAFVVVLDCIESNISFDTMLLMVDGLEK